MSNSDGSLKFLYAHDGCLAVDKPAGLATQAPLGIDSLELRLRRHFREHPDGFPEDYLGIVHRLDRPVSGVILFARRKKVARRLSKQFERRSVRKLYWALVEGEASDDEHVWRDHVRKIPGEARAELVPPDCPQGQLAIGNYRVMKRTPLGTLLEIELETGRFHQIRIQAAARGHPVVGDTLYGASTVLGPPGEDPRQRPIALHARAITFRPPGALDPITVTAELPSHWPVEMG